MLAYGWLDSAEASASKLRIL